MPVDYVALLVRHPGHPVAGVAAAAPPTGSLMTSVLLYAGIAGAALLVAPALTRLPRTRILLVLQRLVALAYAGCAVGAALAHAAPLVAAAGGVAALLGAVGVVDATAAGLAALTATVVLGVEDGGSAPLLAVHLTAASVWLGGVAQIAVAASRRASRAAARAAVRTFTPWAVGSASLLVGSGVWMVTEHHLDLTELLGSAFGGVVVTKAVAVAVAVAIALRLRRVTLARVEAGVLAVALGLGASLPALAVPAAAVAVRADGVATVRVGARTVSVVVVGDAGGTRAVVLGGGPVSVEDLRARAGRAVLRLRTAGASRTVTLPVVVTPSPPAVFASTPAESDAYDVGWALGHGVTGSEACDVTAEATGLAMGTALRLRRVTAVRIVGASTRRGTDLAAGLRRSGVHLDPAAPAVVVAAEPGATPDALRRLARTPGVAAIYLAPWLLDRPALSVAAELPLPPVTVAALGDPMSPTADRYRAALAAAGSDLAPSGAGLAGYAAPRPSLQLFAASPVGFLPGVVDVAHRHTDDGWLPSGTLVATSDSVPVTAHCPTP